jgi:hypothetical protein
MSEWRNRYFFWTDALAVRVIVGLPPVAVTVNG